MQNMTHCGMNVNVLFITIISQHKVYIGLNEYIVNACTGIHTYGIKLNKIKPMV